MSNINYNIYHYNDKTDSYPYTLEDCGLSFILLSNNINLIDCLDNIPNWFHEKITEKQIKGFMIKPFALMIRLFANISAGHIIILALISIIFINKNIAWGALSVPMALFISCLEMLVAVLQAYLFALLSALFIGAAVEESHH